MAQQLSSGSGAKTPGVLFSSSRSGVGRTLAAALLGVRLCERHRVLLADWGFDQSPLFRYFEVEHLAVVHPEKAKAGIFAAPSLALFSSSHFSDDKSARTAFSRLEENADIIVVSSEGSLPKGLNRRFGLGFAVFDYTQEASEKVGKTMEGMSVVCKETLAVPSLVDQASPTIDSQRERAMQGLSANPLAQQALKSLELSIIRDRGGLFDLIAFRADAATGTFVDGAVGFVLASCSPASGSVSPGNGSFPMLVEKVGHADGFLPPPPLGGLPGEAIPPDEPPRASPESGGELSGETGAPVAAEVAREIDSVSSRPPEEKAGDPEGQSYAHGGHHRRLHLDMAFPEKEEDDDEGAEQIAAAADGKVAALLDGRFPENELNAWAGFDAAALKDKHAESLERAGFVLHGKDVVKLFAGMNQATRGWSAAKLDSVRYEMLLYCLWLADEAVKMGESIEANVRHRAELLFRGVDWARLSAGLKVVRVLNLVEMLAACIASSSGKWHAEAEAIVQQIVDLTPHEETQKLGKLGELRGLAMGLALRLPVMRSEEIGQGIKEQFERERDALSPQIRRLLPEFRDQAAVAGPAAADGAPMIEFPISAETGAAEALSEGKEAAGPLLGSPFPLHKLQDWVGYDIREALRQLEKTLKKDGFSLPAAEVSAAQAYADFNKKYRAWLPARKSKHWGETTLLCLALADHARTRREPVEEIIRERVEEIFENADSKDIAPEGIRVLRLLNLVGLLCTALEIGTPDLLKRAESVLLKIVGFDISADPQGEDTLPQLRRVGLALALHLPMLQGEQEAPAREMFEGERDLLPPDLRELVDDGDIRTKVREIRRKVDGLL